MSGSHVIRYLSHEWSGIQSDFCIKQPLMKTSKSNRDLSSGCFCNSEWVQALSYLSFINRFSETVTSQHQLRGWLRRKQQLLLTAGWKRRNRQIRLTHKISSYLVRLYSSVNTAMVSILKRLLSLEENCKYSLMVTSQQQHWREN